MYENKFTAGSEPVEEKENFAKEKDVRKKILKEEENEIILSGIKATDIEWVVNINDLCEELEEEPALNMCQLFNLSLLQYIALSTEERINLNKQLISKNPELVQEFFDLPTETEIPLYVIEDVPAKDFAKTVTDWINDEFGCPVKGFAFKESDLVETLTEEDEADVNEEVPDSDNKPVGLSDNHDNDVIGGGSVVSTVQAPAQPTEDENTSSQESEAVVAEHQEDVDSEKEGLETEKPVSSETKEVPKDKLILILKNVACSLLDDYAALHGTNYDLAYTVIPNVFYLTRDEFTKIQTNAPEIQEWEVNKIKDKIRRGFKYAMNNSKRSIEELCEYFSILKDEYTYIVSDFKVD